MKKVILVLALQFVPLTLMAGWVEGVPVAIQKTDYNGLHLIYIQMETPVTTSAQCTSTAGIVFEDSNESSKAVLSMAMTALVSGKRFRCYVNSNRCLQNTGAASTYPVCDYYPMILK